MVSLRSPQDRYISGNNEIKTDFPLSREETLIQSMMFGQLANHLEQNKCNPDFMSYTCVNGKWIKHLSVKNKINHKGFRIKYGKLRYNLELGKAFLHMAPKEETIKEKLNR